MVLVVMLKTCLILFCRRIAHQVWGEEVNQCIFEKATYTSDEITKGLRLKTLFVNLLADWQNSQEWNRCKQQW